VGRVDDLTPMWPSGYRSRPATTADVPTIHELVAACERNLFGRAQTDPDGIAADLARPGLVPAVDTMLVHDPAGALAAWAWFNRRSEVDVHPDHRGRGLGGTLLDWVEARARQAGAARIVQTVPDGDAVAVALVRSRGYEPLATSWLLEIAMPSEPPVADPPAGITVRAFRPGDERAAHELIEDAFDEWQERRRSLEEWRLHTVDRATFAPALSPVAFHGDQMVGAVIALDDPNLGEGYLEQVAVRRDQRNRGLARALLRWSFRAFHRHGLRSCTLWTHSLTGALALYERVGMTVRRSSTVFSKPLGPGSP
jgi:mycothiol synthase